MYALKLSAKGWHGVIADTFTFNNLSRIAEVYAAYLKELGCHSVAIAFDRRFNHHLFARHLAEQLSARDIKVYLSSAPVPSSVLRLAIRGLKTSAGIMLSASQLPEAYGGVQLYDASAQLLGRHIYQELNAQLQQQVSLSKPETKAAQIEIVDLKESYFETLKAFLDLNVLRKIKGTIIHNALAGVMEGWLTQFVLHNELKLVVQEFKVWGMGDGHLHDFILQDVGSDLLFYLNTNSDGSKLGLYLPQGEQLNRHQVSHIILDYLHLQESEKGFPLFAPEHNWELPWLASDTGFKASVDALVSGDLIAEDKQFGLQKSWQLNLLKEDALACSLMLMQIQAIEALSFEDLLVRYEDTDWRRSFGIDRVKLKTKRLPRRFIQEIPEVLADHKVLGITQEEHLKLTFEGKTWLEFRLDKQGEKSTLLLRCQADTSSDVKNLLKAAKVLVHTIAGY